VASSRPTCKADQPPRTTAVRVVYQGGTGVRPCGRDAWSLGVRRGNAGCSPERMVPHILFFSVAAVGVLGVVVMFSIAKHWFGEWRRARARVQAQAARVAETARLKVEQGAMLAKLQPQPVVPVVRGELTGIIDKLEESTRFAMLPGPTIAAPPRARMPKGSVPIPMSDPTPVVPGAIRAVVASAPPPIPRRALASRPPPIPVRPPRPRSSR